MLLTDEPIDLESSPRAVSAARRWVRKAIGRMGRDDLLEAAELGTSELVTNALMHAEPPFRLQVRGTPEHPRVEVHDGSVRPPVAPSQNPISPRTLVETEDVGHLDTEALDQVLATFGRGLSLVAMASVAWGAEIEEGAKVVWFEPAAEIDENGGPEPTIESQVATTRQPPADGVGVEWWGMEPMLFASMRRHYYELRRELRLLTMAHRDDYPLASRVAELMKQFEPHFPPEAFVAFPDQAGEADPGLNVRLLVSPSAAVVCAEIGGMFDLADRFCRSQQLLSLARTPEVREHQNWFLAEVVHQVAGGSPRRWVARPSVA